MSHRLLETLLTLFSKQKRCMKLGSSIKHVRDKILKIKSIKYTGVFSQLITELMAEFETLTDVIPPQFKTAIITRNQVTGSARNWV
jgi:hypothetical protein